MRYCWRNFISGYLVSAFLTGLWGNAYSPRMSAPVSIVSSIQVPSTEYPTLLSAINTDSSEIRLVDAEYTVYGEEILSLKRRRGHHLRIIGVNKMTRTQITSNAHSIFQVLGCTSVELVNLKLNHVCSLEDKRKIGGAIFSMGKSAVVLKDCELRSSHGFAVWLVQNSKMSAESCIFSSIRRSGCVLFGRASARVTDSLVYGCSQHGICLRGCTDLVVINSKFENCKVRAIYGYASARVEMEDVCVTGTESVHHAAIEIHSHLGGHRHNERDTNGNGWGLRAQRGRGGDDFHDEGGFFFLRMRRCHVVKNAGIGLYIRRPLSPLQNRGGGIGEERERYVLVDCIIEGNTGGDTVIVDEVAICTSSTEYEYGTWQWQYEVEGGEEGEGQFPSREWRMYTKEISCFLSEEYSKYLREVTSESETANPVIHLPEPYTHYSINFATMMQTNINTYFERAVRSVLVSVSPQGKGNHASSPDIDVHTNTEKSEVEHTHTLQPKPKIMSEIEPESIDERESTQNEYSSLVPEHSENLFFDAHCHIHLQIEKAIPYVKSLYEQNRGVAICGTHPEDWEDLLSLKKQFGNVRAGLGIHPYHAHAFVEPEVRARALQVLVQELEKDRSLYVGEIGIDKAFRNKQTKQNEFHTMRVLFEEQFNIASVMQRPIVIHNVRAHGYLLDFLRGRGRDTNELALPPKLYFHAYGGSVETVKELLRVEHLRDRVYFGFARSVNMRNMQKLKSLLSVIPKYNLLLESDAEDVDQIDTDLEAVMKVASQCSGVKESDICRQTIENALGMFDTL